MEPSGRQSKIALGKSVLYGLASLFNAGFAAFFARRELAPQVLADDPLVLKNLGFPSGAVWCLWLLRILTLGALTWSAVSLWKRRPEGQLLISATLIFLGLESLRAPEGSEAGPLCLGAGLLLTMVNIGLISWVAAERRKGVAAKATAV